MMRAILLFSLPSNQASVTPKLEIIGKQAGIDMEKICSYFNEKTKDKSGTTEIGIALYDDNNYFNILMGKDLYVAKGIYPNYITQNPNFHIRNYYLKLEKERNVGWNSGYMARKEDFMYPLIDMPECHIFDNWDSKSKEEKIRIISKIRKAFKD